MKRDDDAEIVRRCLEGRTREFEALVDRYERPLYNVAFRILGDREEAADVVQSTFLKAWESLRTYDPAYRFFSWIYRIAIHESINRKHARRDFVSFPDLEADLPAPDATLERDDAARAVQRALMALSMDHRTVIVLRHFGGCHYREIAEILALPEKTVKSRLFEARHALREVLEEAGVRRP